MHLPLHAFLLTAVVATAAEPSPKLVPRPIPGLPTAKPFEAPTEVLRSGLAQPVANAAVQPAPVNPDPAVAVPVNEPARVLFVHRRDRLPEAMRQRLKALPAEPPRPVAPPVADKELIEERPAAIRIIPKSEVPLLKPPAPPPQP